MQFTIILEGSETPAQLAKVRAAVNAYCYANVQNVTLKVGVDTSELRETLDAVSAQVAARPRQSDQVVADAVARAEADKLAALEAENPQFGQQPLPTGAVPLYGDAAQAQARADVLAAGPLAPSAAPSPAVAEASASAPAAAPASIPSPPPAASAVPSPPPAAATPAPAAAVDSKGLPWDERIHASSRAKIADGSWRMKRGVEPALVTKVEAELRAQIPPAAPPTTFAAAPANGAPVPPPPTPAAPAPLPPGPPELTFGIVASRIGKAVTAGTLSGNVLSVKLAQLGFPDGLHTVNARPDMWAKVLDTLGA